MIEDMSHSSTNRDVISFISKGRNRLKPKMKSLKDLDFFKKFVEPPEWKGRSSADIAQELRDRSFRKFGE
jgi:hypothetical protein